VPAAGVAGGPVSRSTAIAGLVVLTVIVIIAVVLIASRPSGFGGTAATSQAPSASPGGSPASGSCPTAQPAALAAGQKRLVTIETAKGKIGITVEADLSPIAAGNFVALAGCGYYNGVVFHRVATLPDGTPFVIQGGDPTGSGSGGPGYEIKDEPVTATYKRGTVAMARTAAPNSVGSQFFIVLDDKDRSVLESANTYQIIGSVTSGMDTVDAIYAAAGGKELPPNPVVMDKVTVSTP
jgi:cyclophilin family peptidyl-prolyl cis-trans isomerase